MQLSSSNMSSRASRRSTGFTLVELMVVVAIVGVMAAFAVPSYYRAVEQSRVDIAGANLRAIWAAERLYWLSNHTYTTDLGTLKELGLLDPNIPIADPSSCSNYWTNYFYFTATAGGNGIPTSFTAQAKLAGYVITGTGGTSLLTINQDGELSGYVKPSASSNRKVEPIDFW
jgi:prepilin-type N-terminal cleavage/methylation domain-containing protein